ncbi:MAG: MipA/OmpV family protein [Gammaproteobacteria bacterium]|nr:MAG: MipA/OmpV family protein [Gammaproteobacteria bacterium]
MQTRKPVTLKLLPLLIFALSFLANAESKYEIGVGAIATSIPDYIGSDESTVFAAPFPYFWYESEKVTIDRNALQGEMWETEKFKLEISAGGSIPVKSEDNKAREGMEDLDWVGEIGPAFMWFLSGRDDDRDKIYIDIGIRGAVASDLRSINYIGYTIAPKLVYEKGLDSELFGRLDFVAKLGLPYTSAGFHDYVYGVEPRYATAERPAYEAKSGFDGIRLAAGISARKNDIWYGVFCKYYDISNASFADSPLVKESHSFVYGVAAAYIFKSHKK